MTYSRRTFLHTAGAAALTTCLPTLARAGQGATRGAPHSRILLPARGHWSDPDLSALAARAVDAAMTAGAAYADVRITLLREQAINMGRPAGDDEWHGVGVRVLVNGYWGFMGSAVWTSDEVVRLARGAVAQAKANNPGIPRETELGPAAPPAVGEWRMPVKYDPFDIPFGERVDFWNDVMQTVPNIDRRAMCDGALSFQREQKIFASSDGARWTQTRYVTGATFSLAYQQQLSSGLPDGRVPLSTFTPAGKGWEYISESGIIDMLPALIDEAEQRRYVTPVEVNRYDAVFSAEAMAVFADPTLGTATELDRALGYEANASGTSYLNQPLEMLGTYKVGTSLLTCVGDRSTPGGLATVKWDDEGIAPEPFTLIKDGVLVDYQTTREQAAWLAPYYKATNKPIQSHGCAGAQSGLFLTMQHAPNLRILPGKDDISFDDLVKDTKKGVAVVDVQIDMDQQQLNGTAFPSMREITNGKLGRYLQGAGIAFRAPEFWRNLVAVGGSKSERWIGVGRSRGQPSQFTMHSVGAVPGKVTGVGVIDLWHKA